MKATIQDIEINQITFDIELIADKMECNPDDWTCGWYPEWSDFIILNIWDKQGNAIDEHYSDIDKITDWLNDNQDKIEQTFEDL